MLRFVNAPRNRFADAAPTSFAISVADPADRKMRDTPSPVDEVIESAAPFNTTCLSFGNTKPTVVQSIG
jgi:hypothetical protein